MSVFNSKPASLRLYEDDYFYIIEDAYPVSPGHLLIISKREICDFFDLNKKERKTLSEIILQAKSIVAKHYNPQGYNIGMNCGVVAGQTVMHFHCHVIPRYEGDTPDPRGGIRNCIPGKGAY